MSKACFDKLQHKSALVQKHAYKVNGANGNSLGPLRITIYPHKKFPQQFIVCEHLLCPIIFSLDWFSSNQLHLHQGHWSIVILDLHHFLYLLTKFLHYLHHTY